MARKYPKYIKPTGNTLGYQRAIPTRLLHVSTKKLWTYPLGLPVTASDTQIASSWAKANEAFELHCKTLTNSSPAAYSESEIDRLAEEFLRRKGLQRGQFADVVNPELAAEEDARQEQLQAYPDDYADHVIPEADEVRQELYKSGNRQPTVHETATLRAWEAVQTRRSRRPRTLSTLWSAYIEYRGVDLTTRQGQRIQGRWDKFIAVAKDVMVSAETPDHIEVSLDDYVDIERERGIAESSITRNLREPLACLRWANRNYRLKWRQIQLPPPRNHQKKAKRPLNREDQQKLLEYCLQANDWGAATLLLMLQGGCMPSEIMRLRLDEDINLDAEVPHIIISGGDEGITKQEARKRIVPIVVGLDIIRDNIAEATERLSRVQEPSATISKRLRTHVSNTYSSHCLRHTFRANGASVSANPLLLEAIGGWSGSNVNRVMLEYGATGIGESETLKELQKESLKIHAHLLHPNAET